MFCMVFGQIRAAIHFHFHLLHRILSVPMEFFDTTPKGRILSRFSADIDVIDGKLPVGLAITVSMFFRVCQLHNHLLV